MTTVWCLFFEEEDENGLSDWDLFGVYSSEELARIGLEARKMDNGKYEGLPGHYYTHYKIDTRIIDYNLPT